MCQYVCFCAIVLKVPCPVLHRCFALELPGSENQNLLRSSSSQISAPIEQAVSAMWRSGSTPRSCPWSESGNETPTPAISVLLRERPVLLMAGCFPYGGPQVCGDVDTGGSCSKAAGSLSKVLRPKLVLGVGVFSPLSIGFFFSYGDGANKRPRCSGPLAVA